MFTPTVEQSRRPVIPSLFEMPRHTVEAHHRDVISLGLAMIDVFDTDGAWPGVGPRPIIRGRRLFENSEQGFSLVLLFPRKEQDQNRQTA